MHDCVHSRGIARQRTIGKIAGLEEKDKAL